MREFVSCRKEEGKNKGFGKQAHRDFPFWGKISLKNKKGKREIIVVCKRTGTVPRAKKKKTEKKKTRLGLAA